MRIKGILSAPLSVSDCPKAVNCHHRQVHSVYPCHPEEYESSNKRTKVLRLYIWRQIIMDWTDSHWMFEDPFLDTADIHIPRKLSCVTTGYIEHPNHVPARIDFSTAGLVWSFKGTTKATRKCFICVDVPLSTSNKGIRRDHPQRTINVSIKLWANASSRW